MWIQKPKFGHFLKILAYVTAVCTFMPNVKDKVEFPEPKELSSRNLCNALPGTACSWLRETEEKQLLPLDLLPISNLHTF